MAPRKLLGIALAIAGVATGVALAIGRVGKHPPDRSPEGVAAQLVLKACRSHPKAERIDCYQGALESRLADAGVGSAMSLLMALARADDRLEREGHALAHGIGIKGYLLAQNVPVPFDQCPVAFASGCKHGVVQAYLEGQDAVDSVSVNALCEPYRTAGETRFNLFQCVHGMGHGFQMMYQGDLPRALGSCDQLRDGWDRDSCYGGAFMENIVNEIAPHHPSTKLVAGHQHGGHAAFKALDSADLLYPCSIVARKFWRPCYEIQTSAILHFTDNDIGRAADACATAPEEMQPVCSASLGRDISSRALRDPGKSIRLCKKGGEHNLGWCYFGTAKALIGWSSDPSDGIALCRRVGDSPGWEQCYQGVGEELVNLIGDRDQRARVCAEADRPEAVAVCQRSAGVILVTTRTDSLKS